MTTIGTIELIATINTSSYKKGAKDIDDANKGIEASSDRASSSINTGFSKAAKVGLAAAATAAIAVGAAITSNIGDAIRRVDTLNNSSRTFANMGFSVSAVESAMKDLDQSIRGLPTTLDSAIKGVQLLAGATNDVGRAQKIFTALNNGIIGFGGTAEDVSGAVRQLSQDIAGGRIQSETWNSLLDRGLGPALNAIARDMGMNVRDLKESLGEGTVSTEQFTDALIKLNTKGGGGMESFEKIAKDATSGISTGWQNMQTAITRGVANVLKAIGPANLSGGISNLGKTFEDALTVFAEFIPKIVDLGKQVGEYLNPKVTALWKTINEKLMPILKDLWKNVIEPLAPVVGTVLVAAIGLAIDALNLLVSGFSWVYQAIKDGNPIIIGLVALFGTLAAAMAFNAVFNALTVGFNTLTLVTIPNATASITAFRALVASPLVMGAIGVAAAVASILYVHQKLDEFRRDVEGTFDRISKSSDSTVNATKQLSDLLKNGTPEQKARAKKAFADIAAGRSYSSGGFTGVGAVDEIAGVVHRGEFVLPKSEVDQSTGRPKAELGGANITINLSGVMARSKTDLRDIGNELITLVNQGLAAKGKPLIGGGNI